MVKLKQDPCICICAILGSSYSRDRFLKSIARTERERKSERARETDNAYNPYTWEANTGRSKKVQGQPVLQSKTLSPKTKQNKQKTS